MGFKPNTASEINQFRIERTLKRIKRGDILNKDEYDELQRRFKRLEKESKVWYEDLHGKYVAMSMKKTSATY